MFQKIAAVHWHAGRIASDSGLRAEWFSACVEDRGFLRQKEAAGSKNVLRVESRFEAAHEGKVRAGRTPDVDPALESHRAPGERRKSVFSSAESKNCGNCF